MGAMSMNLQNTHAHTHAHESVRRTTRMQVSDRNALLVNRTQEVQSSFELSLRVVRLNHGRNHSDVDVLGADVVRSRDFGNVNV